MSHPDPPAPPSENVPHQSAGLPYGYELGAVPPSEAERNWAVVCHIGPLVGSLFLPVVAAAVPAVVWALKGGDSPHVKAHAVEALNFQITALIYLTVATVLSLVLVGFLLLAVLVPFYLVCSVLAAINASAGRPVRYPLTLRLVS